MWLIYWVCSTMSCIVVDNWHAKQMPYHTPDLSSPASRIASYLLVDHETFIFSHPSLPASGDILILTNIKILSRFPGQEPDILPRSYFIWKDLNFSSRSIKAHFIKGFHFYHLFCVPVSPKGWCFYWLQTSVFNSTLLTFTNELLWSHGWFSPQNSFKEISRDPWRAHYFRPRLNLVQKPD